MHVSDKQEVGLAIAITEQRAAVYSDPLQWNYRQIS